MSRNKKPSRKSDQGQTPPPGWAPPPGWTVPPERQQPGAAHPNQGQSASQPRHAAPPPRQAVPQPRQPYPGPQPYSGPQTEPRPNVPHSGQPQPRQPYPGQPHPGQPHPGQPQPGQPQPGQPQPGQPHPGQPQPGQPEYGRQVPIQAAPLRPNQPHPPSQGGLQLPVPMGYGSQPPQPVQYMIVPQPAYWGQQQPPAINMISAEEEARTQNWRRFLTLLSILALAMLALILYGYSQGNLVVSPLGGEEALAENAPITNLTVNARIQPARLAALSYPVGGIIQKKFVQEGEVVEAGVPLLALDDSRQIVAMAQAQASLEQAEARLLELETGARTQEIIAAQAVVDAARARYNSLTSAVGSETIAAAEAQLAAAQAALQDLLNGPDPNAAIEARAELQAAEAAVSRAQSAYNQVKWRNDVAMLPESQALQEATTTLEAVRARGEQKLKGASAAEISQARAQVKEAEAEIQRVRNPVAQGDIDASAAELRSAEATLEMVESGSRSEVIAFAQAEVSAAQATLLEAEVALQETKLIAPYSGIVVELQADVGEFVDLGAPVMQFGDLTTLKFETEVQDGPAAKQIDEGMPVLIKIAELGDLAMTGRVTSIKASTSSGGDRVFAVFVEPDEIDERLTWKMRSQIFFQFE